MSKAAFSMINKLEYNTALVVAWFENNVMKVN